MSSRRKTIRLRFDFFGLGMKQSHPQSFYFQKVDATALLNEGEWEMGMRILVVDDSSIMRKMIAKTLKAAGHEILGEAKSGIDAIEMYKSLGPDLVTMDITMRGMDGLEAAREILKYDTAALIVFLSNLEKETYKKDARRLGAMGYLSKHDPEKILSLIRELELSRQTETA